MKYKNEILIIIIVIAVFARVLVAIIMGDNIVDFPGIADQLSYHTLAVRLLSGNGFSFPTQWWPDTAPDQPTSFWSYLYTIYLAVVYFLAGSHPVIARLVQAVLSGILSPFLTYHIAVKVFHPLSIQKWNWLPLLAAVWVAVYGYFIYYAGALMTESFTVVSILWAINVTLSIQAGDERWNRWAELGLALGFALLLRQVTSFLILCVFAWLLWTRLRHIARGFTNIWKACRPYLLHSLVTVGILVLMIAPITWYNYQRFGRFVLLNTNAGYAFYWSNHPIHGTKFIPLFTPDMPSYQDLIPVELRSLNEAELEQALMHRGLGFILQDPKRYVLLSLSRIPEHFKFWPSPDSGLLSNITRVCSIGIALPFMLLGSVLWITAVVKKREKLEPGLLLQAFAWGYAGIHILSWAGIRYRLPTDAILLIFAAYSVSWLLNWFFIRRTVVLK